MLDQIHKQKGKQNFLVLLCGVIHYWRGHFSWLLPLQSKQHSLCQDVSLFKAQFVRV